MPTIMSNLTVTTAFQLMNGSPIIFRACGICSLLSSLPRRPIAGSEPRPQAALAIALFGTLVVVVVGSVLGEAGGIKNFITSEGPWFWLGTQGFEFLNLGRLWQILLLAGMIFWVVIVFRALKSHFARNTPATCPGCSSIAQSPFRSSMRQASGKISILPSRNSGASGWFICGSRISWNCSPPSWWRFCSHRLNRYLRQGGFGWNGPKGAHSI